MARNWKDLGEVLSGRDLAEGERVTLNVFDKSLKTLLEQITFRPSRQQTAQKVWAADFCREINTRSALVRAGLETASGEWEVLESSYLNHFWNITSRELQLVATLPRQINWSSDERVALHSTKTLSSTNTSIRVQVRSATGELLETINFTPSAGRLTPGLWTKDLAIQINNTSQLVRAGRESGNLIEPYWEGNSNYIWIPKDSGLSVSWSFNGLREAGKILSDRAALDQEQISLHVFDDIADRPLDRITLIARTDKNRLKQEQWPADLAKQINASSSHARAGAGSTASYTPKDDASSNLIFERYAELRTFTTALHLDNWVQGATLEAKADLTAAQRIVVMVSTTKKGNFCEELTFTPDPARLKAAQWAKDLAAHLNQHSRYLKAGVKDTTKKTIAPKEDAKANLVWLPKDSGLKVSWETSELKEIGYLSLERDMAGSETCKVFVLNDTTEEILREINFRPVDKRNGMYQASRDLAVRINSMTQLIAAGEKVADEKPAPLGSGYRNKLWACAKNVRAFTTLMSLKNWDKGQRIGPRDLREDEQVVLIVKGGKSGRIFESLLFRPIPGRFSKTLWPKDFCNQINARCRFIRGGQENTTTHLMEPMHKQDANFFWIPKGSGLVVESQIISGIPYDVPGMTSETKELFDKYAESRKHIFVDTRTGQADLNIPVAELFADDGFTHPLKVSLSYDAEEGVHLHLNGGVRHLQDHNVITLRSGRSLQVDLATKSFNGDDFRLDVHSTEERKNTFGYDFTVNYKDGVREDYTFTQGKLSGNVVVRLKKVILPSGNALELIYDLGRVTEIKNGRDTLARFEWFTKIFMSTPRVEVPTAELKSMVVFPNDNEARKTYTFTQKQEGSLQTVFELDGFGASGKQCCTVTQDREGRLSSLQITQQHDFTESGKTVTDSFVHRETLAYTVDGKVDRHVIALGFDDLVHDYTYASDSTRLTGYFRTQQPRTAFVRTYRFSGGQSFFEEYGSAAVPLCRQSSHALDQTQKCLVSQSKSWEGEVAVEQQGLTVDAVGNPVSRREDDTITYWTYYNNYQQYKVTETAKRVEDWSFFGFLFKLVDYVNPIGLGFVIGGSGGMSWGTQIDTKVEMLPAKNDYAKDAFNLPVAITHTGSHRPLSSDVESELVCQRIDGKEVPQRLTFFGYEVVDDVLRPRQKLVILQPDCTRVNVVDQQLKVAQAAAKQLTDSLNKQIKATSGAEQTSFKQTLSDLDHSLKEQSKVNGEGFKLGSWKPGSMSLETFEYHTDSKLPGYGTLKSVETVLLDDQGKTIETSRRKTSFEYSVDAKDSRRLTIKTTISRTGATSVESSQTRSRNTGRLLESTDSEGVKTVWSHDPQGNLKSEKVSQGTTTLRETTVTVDRGPVFVYDMVEDGSTTRMVRDMLGRKQSLKMKSASTWLELHSWTYDPQGRIATQQETDYGKDNKKAAQRRTTWSYDELTGAVTQAHVLKGADGKDLKKSTQVRTPSVRGARVVQGNFTSTCQFDVEKKTLTEHYVTSGSGACRIERKLGIEGLLKSVRYLVVDASGKESEHDRIDYSYDAHGQLSKVAPRLGAASTYSHDSAGRLLSTSRDGVVLSNTYDPASLAAVAKESHVKAGSGSALSLGTQTVDLFGRASSQSVNGCKTEFSYTGASTCATLKTPGTTPTALTGYSSSMDKAKRSHVQTLDKQSSTLVFTTGGRVQTFTDLTGTVTTYEYDFFDRVVGSSNDQCVCTFTYADNGLLASESIKALKAGNLTMKVSYSYDALGQETRRVFTCEGIETLTLERTLLADGRLGKSTLKSAKTAAGKVTEKELCSDSYEYDASLRLKKWTDSRRSADINRIWDTWVYDALGNITKMQDSKAMVRYSGTFSYDAAKLGQVTDYVGVLVDDLPVKAPIECHPTHDDAGRLTSSGDRKLAYHGNGQVKSCSLDGNKTQYSFSYDSEGRVRGGSIGKLSDTYHYRGERVYALVQGDEAKSQGFAKRTLVLRNDSQACLMQDAISDDKTSRSFELRDANGSVIASIDLETKAITHFRYRPYGERFEGEKATSWLGFKGEPLNRVGLYHLGNGYRLYDPVWGRFLAPDDCSPFGVGGAAAYVFGNGDPVNHADPSGHQVIAQYQRWGASPVTTSTAFRVTVGAIGLLMAPFSAGTSILLAVATTTLAALTFSFDIAALIIEKSDPQLSRTLEAWGKVFGMFGAFGGIAASFRSMGNFPKLGSLLKTRGGPQCALTYPVKWPITASELRVAQQVRSNALAQLIQGADDAKAAGTYEAFKARYFNPEGSVANGVTLSIPTASGVTGSIKNLFKGGFDDSLVGYLGAILDWYSGPVVAFEMAHPKQVSQTDSVSIVAGPMPGREKLFP